MFETSKGPFKIVYVDTNVLSNVCKNSNGITNFISKYPGGQVLSNSVFTLYELSKDDEVFNMYKNQFFCLPSLILDSGISITNKEIAVYFTKKPIKIVIVSPTGISVNGKKMHPEALHRLFERKEFKDSFGWWDRNLPLLYEDFLNLKVALGYSMDDNLNPKVGQFVKKCVYYFLQKYHLPFWNQMKKKNEEIDIDRFPSLKMMAYSSFYKFFSENRTPEMNDIMDIIISTTVPYTEVFVSEKNLINVVMKIKSKDNFINHVQLQTISEYEKVAEIPIDNANL